MKRKTEQKRIALGVACATLLSLVACAGPQQQGPNVESGFRTAGQGLVHIVLSPIQITAGLLEGVSSLPYFAATGLHQINSQLNESQAKVTLRDTYQAAYGQNFDGVDDSGDTGQAFQRMKDATVYFRRVLKRSGVADHDRYLLTSIDTAKKDGYILFAVVYRPASSIRVIDKYDGRTVRTYDEADRMFYEPFAKTTDGRALDTVIDYGAVPVDQIQTQKAQALLLTLAANSVTKNRRAPEYWELERSWIAGEHRAIINRRNRAIEKRMRI